MLYFEHEQNNIGIDLIHEIDMVNYVYLRNRTYVRILSSRLQLSFV